MSNSNQPLNSYRVLNLADEKGCFCAKILADLGADVIKVEPPHGDAARNVAPFLNNHPHSERSLYWFAYYTNQRSITLDIQTIEGQSILKKLVKYSDFLVESFAPGHMDKLNLCHSTLNQINPSIIVISITPFGQEGPYKDWKGSDIVISAMSGSMYLGGDTDRAPLRIGGVEQSYLVSGAYAAAGGMIAHYYRTMSGKGQHIDTSAQESMAFTTMSYYMYQDLEGHAFQRTGNYYYRYGKKVQLIYPCKDGYISWRLFMGGLGAFTRHVVEWMDSEGQAGELKDIQWEKIGYKDVSNQDYDRWTARFGEFFKTRTKAELQREAIARDFNCSPVNTAEDVLEDAQLSTRKYWNKVSYPELDCMIIHPGPIYRSSKISWGIPRRAPLMGEHNEEIYCGELGYSKEDLCRLRQANII